MPRPHTATPRPFLELRVGGLHLTVQHLPHRLVTVAAAVLGSVGTIWLGR
ncbi:hypothetical protein [Embleya hyalina]|uniref:Uncharacterized protein n=1 Tax=Embleya hyalina TaxID=516124 RepID=A0A401YYN5_9ACTN|nr:hypothetical protein [Embleya hyalina]GCD99698.1 hypothetical protein EHYA_07420 [Embleya hyalina]